MWRKRKKKTMHKQMWKKIKRNLVKRRGGRNQSLESENRSQMTRRRRKEREKKI